MWSIYISCNRAALLSTLTESYCLNRQTSRYTRGEKYVMCHSFVRFSKETNPSFARLSQGMAAEKHKADDYWKERHDPKAQLQVCCTREAYERPDQEQARPEYYLHIARENRMAQTAKPASPAQPTQSLVGQIAWVHRREALRSRPG